MGRTGMHCRGRGLLQAFCLTGVVALCSQCGQLADAKVVTGTTRTSGCFSLLATFQYGETSDEEANFRISVDVPDTYQNVWLVALYNADIDLVSTDTVSCDKVVQTLTDSALQSKGLPLDALDFLAYTAKPNFPVKTRAMRLYKKAGTQRDLWAALIGYDMAAVVDTCPLIDLVLNGFVGWAQRSFLCLSLVATCLEFCEAPPPTLPVHNDHMRRFFVAVVNA